MNERIVELKKKIGHVDELIAERDKAYNEYVRDVEINKSTFMKESIIEVQRQITEDIRNENYAYDEGEIGDRIDDIFSSKCKSLQSYIKYMRLKREIVLINQLKQVVNVHK